MALGLFQFGEAAQPVPITGFGEGKCVLGGGALNRQAARHALQTGILWPGAVHVAPDLQQEFVPPRSDRVQQPPGLVHFDSTRLIRSTGSKENSRRGNS